MNPEWVAAIATIALQLIGGGIAWGKFGQRIKNNEDRIAILGETSEKHSMLLSGLEVRVSVAEAYQRGLQDGTSHMRHV